LNTRKALETTEWPISSDELNKFFFSKDVIFSKANIQNLLRTPTMGDTGIMDVLPSFQTFIKIWETFMASQVEINESHHNISSPNFQNLLQIIKGSLNVVHDQGTKSQKF
jgi:ATP/ADP translocase